MSTTLEAVYKELIYLNELEYDKLKTIYAKTLDKKVQKKMVESISRKCEYRQMLNKITK